MFAKLLRVIDETPQGPKLHVVTLTNELFGMAFVPVSPNELKPGGTPNVTFPY